MKRYAALIACLLAVLAPVWADQPASATPFKARGELGWKFGNIRNIMLSEMFLPLAQHQDALFYGDLRFMNDSEGTVEGNAGLGYRQMIHNGTAIAGGHAWLDRRRTELGSVFYQATLGGEWLTDAYEARLNAYMPLSEERVFNVGSVRDPYLAGTGLYINQIGQGVEEPQPGGDVELGVPIPAAQKYVDSLRLYGGGYYFKGDRTPNVRGWRTRVAADITPDFSIGLRYQRDGVRGTQTFLEATMRFPFTRKGGYQQQGLRARMDESPERDIDIVSSDKTLDSGQRQVINTNSGASQQVIHVDNTSSAGGDGSAERPYNTLAAAQAAAGANAIIYVHQGTGSLGGGITLDKEGQQLIGSGVNFIWDGSTFGIANQSSYTPRSTVIAAATAAPTITNAIAGGDGVRITADNVLVTGITVDGAARNGIAVEASGAGASAQNATIVNVATTNNTDMGVYVHGGDGANVSAMVQNVNATANGTHGVGVHDDTTGTFEVDLGGGSFHSTGNNVLTGNTLEDLAVDYDGRQLAAQHNWWGQAGGPNAGVAGVTKPQVYLGSPLDRGLIGNWTFDTEWMNGTTIYDRSASHNDGTAVNGPTTPAGQFGNGMHFDGANDYANITGSYPTGNGARTLTMWVNSDDTVFDLNADHIVNYGTSSALRAFGNMIHTGNQWAFYSFGADTYTGVPVATGWQQHTITYDGTTMRYYINGTQVATTNATLNTTANNMVFGSRNDLVAGNYYNGSLDDIRIYNRAMVVDEVGQLYRSTTNSSLDNTNQRTSAP